MLATTDPHPESAMHLRSDSFKPYDHLDTRLAFGKHDPDNHFAFAGNRNPHLRWTGAPEQTRSFVVLCVDDDVPSEGSQVNQVGLTVPLDLPRVSFYHWILIDLPAGLDSIAEGAHSDGITARGKPVGPTPSGGLSGSNNYTDWFGGHDLMSGTYGDYDGPAPPWNDERVHGYRFHVYALDVPALGLHGAFTGAQVIAAMQGHVLDSAKILGLYAINPNARQA
ncbi:MAG: Raf kinase inhibitor-like YbhB/YbcL family protein [Kiritimatiellia bacterium]|jgi:Raf kinase inhibitor-like YbhB/YbcL family protein